MELKEIEARIRAEYPEFAKIIDTHWPKVPGLLTLGGEEGKQLWQIICAAYDFGFMKGLTHGLEQYAKTMDFALGKIFNPHHPLDKGFKKD